MPFGVRNVGGVDIDFDHVYEAVLSPAVEGVLTPEGDALEVHRTDQDFFAGDITQDMFEYLEYSRLVLADITSLNPNVFYELGARHRARESGTIIVRQPGVVLPFDIRMAKAFPYEYAPEENAEASRQLIRRVVSESLVEERLDSPIQRVIQLHRFRAAAAEAMSLEAENEVRSLDPWAAINTLRGLVRRPDATALDRMKLGLLLKDQGQWEEAFALFTAITADLPDYAEAWRERGIAENKLAGDERAKEGFGEASLRTAIGFNANDFDAYASLGGVLKRAGRLDEALEAYSEANRYSNGHPYPFLNMLKLRARLSGSLALTGEDRRTLARASRLRIGQSDAGQDLPWSHFDAAELALFGGDPIGAIYRLQRGLEASTEDGQVKTFRQSLTLLTGVEPPIDGLQALLESLD